MPVLRILRWGATMTREGMGDNDILAETEGGGHLRGWLAMMRGW